MSDIDVASLASLHASLEEALKLGSIAKVVMRDADNDDFELKSDADLQVAKKLSSRPNLLRLSIHLTSLLVPVKFHISPSEIRLLTLEMSSLNALKQSLLNALGTEPSVIAWKDQDGDKITIVNDSDLSFAMEDVRRLSSDRPRLHVYGF